MFKVKLGGSHFWKEYLVTWHQRYSVKSEVHFLQKLKNNQSSLFIMLCFGLSLGALGRTRKRRKEAEWERAIVTWVSSLLIE